MRHLIKNTSFLAVGAMALLFSIAGVSANLDDQMKERLAPVGDLCMSGDPCAAAPVAAAPSGPRTGADVYDTKCFSCHGAGVAGAPKMGDAAAWGPRIDKGIDTLYTHAINGFNSMPAKGLCMDCSDEEIQAAVDHIVDSVK